MKIGFVGLGHMGRPMAARLLAAGLPVAVFDVRPEATAGLDAEAATSLADLARRSDAVITMLPTGDAVTAATLGRDEPADRLLDGLRPASILIDMGSSSPMGTRALGRVLAAHGVAMVDAPVSGGVARAEAGTLSIMAGGEPTVVEACGPVFAPLAERVFFVGPLGAGHALKALNNLVSAAGLLAAAEALLVGLRFGLDPAVMVDVFNASTARNNATENKLKQFVLSRSFDSGFGLDLMVKDLATAIELAEHTATPAPLGAACRELWTRARAELGEGADHTAVVRWLEALAGTTLTVREGQP